MKIANKYGKKYEALNIIVAHLGGGVSLSVHEKGKIMRGNIKKWLI